MYNEIMWYVDDNRFSDIVKQIEEFAKEYQDNYYSDSPNHIESKSNFLSLVYYHASKSGYIAKLAPNTDLLSLLVPNGRIDRKALDNFEKEIIKNHMYQKHLWEFMGTTASFGIITKIGLANNKKRLDDYFPIAYRNNIKLKSPIEPILDDIENSVPIYIYFNGNVSTLYDKNMAGEAFDTTADRSGFDWQMKGYDPNYSLSKSASADIMYDSQGDVFSAADKGMSKFYASSYLLFPPESPEPLKLKLMKFKDACVLQDPFYTYIYNPKVANKEENFTEYSQKLLAIIDSAMEYLGIDKINSIVKYKSKLSDEDVLKAYSGVLADRADKKLSFISLENANKELKKSREEYAEDALEKKGIEIASKLDYLVSLGLCGAELENAISTDTALGALSYKSRADLAQNDLTDEEIDFITRLDVPKEKADEFSHTLFNLLKDYSFYSSSIEILDIAEALYRKTVGESFVDRNIDISSTLSRALSTSSTIFDSPARDPRVEERLKMALGEVPDMKKAERLLKAISNAGLRYGYIKALTGMSEKELVNAAVTIFYDNFAPTSSIRYIKGSDPVNQMLFSKIKLSTLLEKQKLNPNEYKSIKPIDYSNMKKSKFNVFDKKGLDAWLESANGKKSGLDGANFDNIRRLLVQGDQISLRALKHYPLSKNKIPLSSYPMDITPLSAEIFISNFLEPDGNTSLEVKDSAVQMSDELYNISQKGISGFAFGGW